MYILYILQTLATPKPTTRKTSLADVIPDWPELKPFRQKKQVSCSKQEGPGLQKKISRLHFLKYMEKNVPMQSSSIVYPKLHN